MFRQVQPVNFVFTHLSDIPWRFEEENVGNKKLLLQPCASVVSGVGTGGAGGARAPPMKIVGGPEYLLAPPIFEHQMTYQPKITLRMHQIAQIYTLVSKIFRGGMPPDPPSGGAHFGREIFTQNHSQNAQNCTDLHLGFKNFPGGHAPGPP